MKKTLLQITLAMFLLSSGSLACAQDSSRSAMQASLYPADTILAYHTDFTKKHYPKRIAEFKADPLAQGDIVFIGNSITEGGKDWSARLGVPHVKNRGISGDITDGVLLRLEELIHNKPKAVFLLIGINDLYNIKDKRGIPSASYVADNIVKIAQKIHEGSPLTKVFVQTVLPTRDPAVKENIIRVNQVITNNEQQGTYQVVDLFRAFVDEAGYLAKPLTRDGVHLTEAGYAKWVELVKPLIEEVSVQAAPEIHSGVPWFDQNGHTVSAHGAGIIKENGRYYLFGEFKTDSANVFNGFACYSSDDLASWKFERMALPLQVNGKLGPKRVGERPKVMKSPTTGEFVMLMHVDSLNYKDQYVGYATAKEVTGPYTFQGPILYQGKPIRRWDIGAFQDDDGTGYLLVHHGDIYRLAPDYRSIEKQVAKGIPGSGESPAMFKKDGLYFLLSSNLTSWERNDNQYHTAPDIAGPWTERGLFAPKGSLTWNSQCSFVLPIVGTADTTFMYMGDRWSFPKQNAAATYVWQPLEVEGTKLALPEFKDVWTVDLATGNYREQKNMQVRTLTELEGLRLEGNWQDSLGVYRSDKKGDRLQYTFNGRGIKLYGQGRVDGGYAQVRVLDAQGNVVSKAIVDMYALQPSLGLKYVSPVLLQDKYTLEVEVMGERGNWSDKRRSNYGSTGYGVAVAQLELLD